MAHLREGILQLWCRFRACQHSLSISPLWNRALCCIYSWALSGVCEWVFEQSPVKFYGTLYRTAPGRRGLCFGMTLRWCSGWQRLRSWALDFQSSVLTEMPFHERSRIMRTRCVIREARRPRILIDGVVWIDCCSALISKAKWHPLARWSVFVSSSRPRSIRAVLSRARGGASWGALGIDIEHGQKRMNSRFECWCSEARRRFPLCEFPYSKPRSGHMRRWRL